MKSHAFQRQTNPLYLPFAADPENALLVAICYRGFDQVSKGPYDPRNYRPVSIGYRRILSEESGTHNMWSMTWMEFRFGASLSEHFTEPGQPSACGTRFEASITDTCVLPRTVRLGSFDPMFASPLLTISNINLDLQHGLISKKGKKVVSLSVYLRKIFPDARGQDSKAIIAFINPLAAEVSECGCSCSVEPVIVGSDPSAGEKVKDIRDKAFFPRPLHFALSSGLRESVMLHIDVYKNAKNKSKKVASFAAALTKE